MPGSPTTPGQPSTRNSAPGHVAFRRMKNVGTRNYALFAAQWLAYVYPCQRFAPHLTMRHA